MKTMHTRIVVLFILAMVQFCMAGCEDTLTGSSREDDEIKLEKLRDEINQLSTQVRCEDAGNWRYMPIGSKPCGGPTGYIAYSAAIDTNEFIRKVKLYTDASDKFNKKWGMVSDCGAIRQPRGIICDNGVPVFVYDDFKPAIGTWLLTEVLSDPGDGSGRYKLVDGPAKHITFNPDGTVAGQALPTFQRYEFLDESRIRFSSSGSQIFMYTLVGDELILRPPCIEACGLKFKRVMAEH